MFISKLVWKKTFQIYLLYIYIYIKNVTVGLHIFYILNMHIKFCLNWKSFTIQSINLFFMHKFILQKFEI